LLFLLCLLEANEVGGRAVEEEVVDVVVSGLLAAAPVCATGGAG
jgi:hypothetical protein